MNTCRHQGQTFWKRNKRQRKIKWYVSDKAPQAGCFPEVLRLPLMLFHDDRWRQHQGCWIPADDWFLSGFQGRCGGLGVLRDAHGTQQPAFPNYNSGQILHSQRQPEGQGQQLIHTNTHTAKHWGQLCRLHFNSLVVLDFFFFHAAWRSGERRQCTLQWQCGWEKSPRPSQDRFGHPDHFCVQGLGFIRYFFCFTFERRDSCCCLTASQLTHKHFNIWITVSGCVRGISIISKVMLDSLTRAVQKYSPT